MKIVFDVTMTDGSKHTVSTVYADILALEDKFDIDASDLANRQRAKWMAFLAWNAMKRSGATTEPFDKFTAQIEDLAPAESEQGND